MASSCVKKSVATKTKKIPMFDMAAKPSAPPTTMPIYTTFAYLS
jgi:hypothetical protein